MRVRRMGLVLALLFIAVTVAACGGNKQADSSSAAVDPVEIVVELGSPEYEFVFVPDVLELKVNQPVRLVLRNMGAHEHDLAIPDFNVQSPRVQPGQEYVLEFTPNKTGTFPFECTVAGHAAAGMVGTVVVTQ